MQNTPSVKIWALPSGALVHINGLPYLTVGEVKISGVIEPRIENDSLAENQQGEYENRKSGNGSARLEMLFSPGN